MSRRMVGDDQDVYRVVRVRKATKHDVEETGTPITEYYGPYNSIGAARAQRTVLGYVDYWDRDTNENIRVMRDGVVSIGIQVARTEWSDVT